MSSILHPRASQTQCYPHFCTKTWSSSYIPYLIRKHHHEVSLPSQKYVIHPNSSPSIFPNLNNNDVMPPRNHICSLLSVPWGNALVQHSWFLTRITMSFKMSPYFQTYPFSPFLIPFFLRYNWHTALYKFKMYSIMIWFAYIVKRLA